MSWCLTKLIIMSWVRIRPLTVVAFHPDSFPVALQYMPPSPQTISHSQVTSLDIDPGVNATLLQEPDEVSGYPAMYLFSFQSTWARQYSNTASLGRWVDVESARFSFQTINNLTECTFKYHNWDGGDDVKQWVCSLFCCSLHLYNEWALLIRQKNRVNAN